MWEVGDYVIHNQRVWKIWGRDMYVNHSVCYILSSVFCPECNNIITLDTDFRPCPDWLLALELL